MRFVHNVIVFDLILGIDEKTKSINENDSERTVRSIFIRKHFKDLILGSKKKKNENEEEKIEPKSSSNDEECKKPYFF